jgi:hypothetical protein
MTLRSLRLLFFFFAGSSLRSLVWFPSVVVLAAGGRKRGKGSKKPPENNYLHLVNVLLCGDLSKQAIFNRLLDRRYYFEFLAQVHSYPDKRPFPYTWRLDLLL